ncbi:flippase-like domain-containing protein, partial [Odoribacter sp. OttesenSCG-928-A06]|nr:flippase-like domain-containing protein [Odoribacter sp. OttesenSCG-928-A06]
YPILIGLAVVSYMLYKEFDINAFKEIVFTSSSLFWLLVALLCMFARDLGYVIRIRILSGERLSWKQSIRVIFLWEFTSAVTPSAIGGTSIAILFVNKEGIKVGRSSAIVMATSFLDELYFIIMFPLILLCVNQTQLWSIVGANQAVADGLFWIAIAGYSVKLAYLLVLSYGLFRNPRGLKYLLMQCFRLKLLRKWRQNANEAGTDIIRNSHELKRMPFSFWLKTFGATFFSWTARYWVVNALLMAFWAGRYGWAEHFLIFARQLIMWIMMLVSPTPGGSGFAEYVFSKYLGEFLPGAGVAVAMAILWRLISYYPYLFVGAFMVPRWVAKHFGTKKK